MKANLRSTSLGSRISTNPADLPPCQRGLPSNCHRPNHHYDQQQDDENNAAAGAHPLPLIEYLFPPCVVAGHSPVTVYIMLSFPKGVLPPEELAGGWRLLAICEGDIISEFLVQPYAGDLVRCELLLAPHPGGVVFMMQGSPTEAPGPPHTLLSLPAAPAAELNDFFTQGRRSWLDSSQQLAADQADRPHRLPAAAALSCDPPPPGPYPSTSPRGCAPLPAQAPATSIIRAQQEYSHALFQEGQPPPHQPPTGPLIHHQGPGPPGGMAPPPTHAQCLALNAFIAVPSTHHPATDRPHSSRASLNPHSSNGRPATPGSSLHSMPPRRAALKLSSGPARSGHHPHSLRAPHSTSAASRGAPSSPSAASPTHSAASGLCSDTAATDKALRGQLLRAAHAAVWREVACLVNARIIHALQCVGAAWKPALMSPPPGPILHSLLDYLYAQQLHSTWHFLVEHIMRAGVSLTFTPQGVLVCGPPTDPMPGHALYQPAAQPFYT